MNEPQWHCASTAGTYQPSREASGHRHEFTDLWTTYAVTRAVGHVSIGEVNDTAPTGRTHLSRGRLNTRKHHCTCAATAFTAREFRSFERCEPPDVVIEGNGGIHRCLASTTKALHSSVQAELQLRFRSVRGVNFRGTCARRRCLGRTRRWRHGICSGSCRRCTRIRVSGASQLVHEQGARNRNSRCDGGCASRWHR